MPVPEPLPIPTNGYSSSSSVGAGSTKSGRGRTSVGSGKYSPDHDSSEGQCSEGGLGAVDGPRFQSLNMAFTGLNGIGGPRALALMRGAAARASGASTSASTSREIRGSREVQGDGSGGGVYGEARGSVQVDARAGEDKSELIRAWEEELVKIEKASHRRSNMLTFWRKRDKARELKQRIAV